MPNSRGFSLIEVLIATGILLTVTLAISTLIIQMNKNIRHAERKIESMELAQIAGKTLSNLTACSCILKDAATPFSDPISPVVGQTAIDHIRADCATTSPRIVESNQPVPGTKVNLKTRSILLANITATGAPDTYRGTVRVNFDEEQGLALLRPLELDVEFSAIGTSSSRVVDQCLYVGAPSVVGPTASITGSCAAGQVLTGISSTGVSCASISDVLGGASFDIGNGGRGFPHASGSPGPGCIGLGCMTSDYGPCLGGGCETNGNFCSGAGCKARGPAASCSGMGCCAGPSC